MPLRKPRGGQGDANDNSVVESLDLHGDMLANQDDMMGHGFQNLDNAEYYDGRVTGSDRLTTDPNRFGDVNNNEYEEV